MKRFIIPLAVVVALIVASVKGWSIPIGSHNGYNPSLDSLNYNVYLFNQLPTTTSFPFLTTQGSAGTQIACYDCNPTNPATQGAPTTTPQICGWTGVQWDCSQNGTVNINPSLFGAKYNLRSIVDVVVTNGGTTVTSPSQGNFQQSDTNALIDITAPVSDFAAGTYMGYHQVFAPSNLTNNPGGLIERVIFPGNSGAGPSQPDWVASSWYEGLLSGGYDCILPLLNNTNASVFCASHGGQAGASEPNLWNQSLGGTQTDGGVTWVNRGPGLWPQCRGCKTYSSVAGGAIFVTTAESLTTWPNGVNTFTGCVLAVNSTTQITLGQLSGGVCLPATYTGASASNVFMSLKYDSTLALNNTYLAFQNNNPANNASGNITLTGWLGLSGPIVTHGSGVSLVGGGMSGSPGLNPPLGTGFIWDGTSGSSMFFIQGRNTKFSRFEVVGNSNPANQPQSYFEMNQHGSPYGATSFNIIDQIGDPSGQGALDWPDDLESPVVDDIRFDQTTQTDREWITGDVFGQPARACVAQLNPQSIGVQIDNLSCFRGPLGIYQPDGGDMTVRQATMSGSGQQFWNSVGHMHIFGATSQDDSIAPYPSQFIYIAQGPGGSGGGYVEVDGEQGALESVNAVVPRDSRVAWGHLFHTGAYVDTDAPQLTLKLAANIVNTTSGFSWANGTPWQVYMQNVTGLLDLRSTGISMANLEYVNAAPGGCLAFNVTSSTQFVNDPTQMTQNLLCNGDAVTFGRFDIGGEARVSGRLHVAQDTPPTAFGTCATAGASTFYYKVTASDLPCRNGLPFYGSESLPSNEVTFASCTTPSTTAPEVLNWNTAKSTSPASWGIYEGSTSGQEVAKGCVDVQTTNPNGIVQNLFYNDTGSYTAGGWPLPTANGTGTGVVDNNLTVGGLAIATAIASPGFVPVIVNGIQYGIALTGPLATPTPFTTPLPTATPTPTSTLVIATPTTTPTATPTPLATATPP